MSGSSTKSGPLGGLADGLAATARGNRILAGLPPTELGRLVPACEAVSLPQHTLLHDVDEEIGYVYFPLSGVASLVATGAAGEQVDTAIIGSEGMVGLPVFLGTDSMPVRATVQIDMTAIRVPAGALRDELERGGRLVNLLQRYSQMVLVELAQLILCNRVHSLEHRVARWILQLHWRLANAARFNMTQEFLAAMVSSPRPHVSQVLHDFRAAGLIDYTRGAMEVLDEASLEAAACACYETIRTELRRLLSTSESYDVTAQG